MDICLNKEKISVLRMERQFLSRKANEEEYIQLYRDMQPGQNVYWNGFGNPPSLTFRADFDDIEFNRRRQARRELIKGRFAGGNLGWIMPEDLELFAALYCKPLIYKNDRQLEISELIEREGPMNIQQMKEVTGMLVKEITPVLHRLQEAFIIYEDQYDGGWDRGWYKFGEIFPDVNINKYTRQEALKTVLRRFAYRNVLFDTKMARSFYKLPEKEIIAAVDSLVSEGVIIGTDGGYILKSDSDVLRSREDLRFEYSGEHTVFAVHRNDFLYKSNEHILKESIKLLTGDLPYDCEPLQYLLIDGEFHGACVGHFRNGPYDLNDVVCDLPDSEGLKAAVIAAVTEVNYGKSPKRYRGKPI